MEYRIDLFAIFIFLGIVQAGFLSFFFFSRENRLKPFNIYYGFFLLSIAACLLEIFLHYSGYIINVLHLVDFSEPFGLLIGPLFYFYVLSLTSGNVSRKLLWYHLMFPIFYSIALIPFFFSSVDYKYNSWISAYHPDWPMRTIPNYEDNRWFILTNYHTELVLVSLMLYIVLSGSLVIKTFQQRQQSFWKPDSIQLRMIRDGALEICVFFIFIVTVKIFNKNDTGDHLFAAFGALLVYTTSISVISRSGFFKQTALNEPQKYKSSSLSSEQLQAILVKLAQVMKDEKPFLNASFSLPDLAGQLNISVHALSQVINDGLGKSFFEMTAEYRIEEAKKLLITRPNIKVEEIAEQVGYNSKSSFNTAFKKLTGKTPSEFRT